MKARNTWRIIMATVFIAASVFAGGCATKSGSKQKVAQADWEWVPSIWVQDSFGSEYGECSYEISTDGYLCPPGTR